MSADVEGGSAMNEDLARQVETSLFTSVRLRASYDEVDVDVFLDRLAAALRVGQPVQGLVDGAAFRVMHSRGYDMGQVDAFLDAIVARAALAGGPGDPGDPGESGAAAPATGPGWVVTGTAADPASWSAPAVPPAPAAVPVESPVESPVAAPEVASVIQEQKGLLKRMFGR